jgi:haloalkane dehalogenase
MPVDAQFPFEKRRLDIDGVPMAYVDEGEGDPIVFLHGNPTSSYLWRNVMPHVVPLGRCIAPDLVGMGDSGKLPEPGAASYSFVEHRRYLDGLLDELGVDGGVTFVVHDWGSALGFDWANRHRDAVAGIVYMEAIVRPLRWEEWPPQARSIFEGLRSSAGEEMVLEKNLFVEAILPASVIRGLTAEEMAEYRRPFAEPGESRRPTLTWPRQIPIDGDPAEVHEIVASYADWLATSDVPKLLVVADPGAILTGDQLEFCRRWPNQREVTVAGNHFVQEDSPDAIGSAIAKWLRDRAAA